MSLWTVEELLLATGGELKGHVAMALKGVAIDSRDVGVGDIFIAIKGDNQDGHKYVAQALGEGAGLAIVSNIDDTMLTAGPLLLVKDTLAAMENIGVASRSRSQAKIIAVTGSVGKTTTKDALGVALGACGKTHLSVASFNNHWGVPLTLARMPHDAEYAVFEIGMNHKGEIAELVKMVRPDIAIITEIGESHLGHFASIEEISDAKAEIFDGIEPGGTAVINQDSRFFSRLTKQALNADVSRVVGFGRHECAEVRLHNSVLHNSCSCVRADVLGQDVTFKLGSPGAHVVMNTLSVLAAVKLVGADLARAVLALAKLIPPKGRGGRLQFSIDDKSFLVIDESYNANPTSMRAALELLGRAEPQGQGRRVAVLGDMLELGESAPQLHADLAEAIETASVDKVYACGDLMEHLWDALPPFRQATWAENSSHLQAHLIKDIQPGDVIMVKGSLGSKMAPLVAAIRDQFSEKEQAA